jgi:hypothetical protein
MTSRSTSIAHGSPSTSTAAVMAHPDRGALSAPLDGKLLASHHCFRNTVDDASPFA